MLTDSHCHLDRLDLTPFGGKLDGALAAARAAGVSRFLCVGIDLENFEAVHAIALAAPDVWCSVGVHPSENEGREPSVADLVERAARPRVVAIGESGLDYYYNEGDLNWQRERFRVHVRAARETGLPLIIHTRDARDDTLAILREENAKEVGGVMHCFTETWEMAEAAMELGFYISFSGIVTFKNAESLRDVARRVPLDRLLVETDSPYLAPIPHRGKSNQPAWVSDVARFVAELRGMSYEALAEQTTANFLRLFARAQ
ncbi:MAG: TatD family hydrolase [Gammaproteobacteria bacterium]|nr:TatD family hydrolase [Gammaproteobacteria bacterium]